jgi:hypothetical protein
MKNSFKDYFVFYETKRIAPKILCCQSKGEKKWQTEKFWL